MTHWQIGVWLVVRSDDALVRVERGWKSGRREASGLCGSDCGVVLLFFVNVVVAVMW